MGLGEKNEERRGKGKKIDKREKKPPKITLLVGAKLIFLEEGGGNSMIYLKNVYPSICYKFSFTGSNSILGLWGSWYINI